MRIPFGIFTCLLLVIITNGCEFAMGEGLAVEGLEARVLASDAIAGRTFAGLALEGASGELGLTASEELASSVTFRTALEELATDARIRVLRDAEGYLSISGTRLGVTEDGAFTLGRIRGGAWRTIGKIQDGRLWEVDVSGRVAKAIGDVRAVTRRPDVAIRGGPSSDARILATLRPGVSVQVLQIKNGWFEIAFRDGTSVGWVEAPLMEVTALATAAHPASPSAGQASRPSQCVGDTAQQRPMAPQSIEYLTITPRTVELFGANGVRVLLDFSNKSDDQRHLAIALKAENSGGIADYWKFFPEAKADLTDDLGTRYEFESVSGLPFARTDTDWSYIPPGETRSAVFTFLGPASGVCLRTYSFSTELWFAFRNRDRSLQRQAVGVFLQGLHRSP